MTYAIQLGQTEIVKQLLLRGAKVERRDGHGWTPYQVAVKVGNEEIVKLLNGASSEAKDKVKSKSLEWKRPSKKQ